MDKAKLIDRMRQKQSKPPKAEPAPLESFHSAGASVKYRCGHSRPIKSFTGQECPECRNKSKTQKAQDRAQARRSKNVQEHGRLPNGAAYEKSYDAVLERWTGILAIGSQVFTAQHSGSLGVERALDQMYREWVKKGGQA